MLDFRDPDKTHGFAFGGEQGEHVGFSNSTKIPDIDIVPAEIFSGLIFHSDDLATQNGPVME